MVLTMQQCGYRTFGIDSKTGKYFFRYPWRTAFIFFLLVESLVILIGSNLDVLIRSSILLLSVLLLNLLITYHFTKNHCYKIILNSGKNEIIFFHFFNRGKNRVRLNGAKVVVHSTCNIVINNNTYAVFPAALHQIIPYLPKNTEIIFSGFFGRIKKRDWERRNINLTPGRY